MTKAGAIATMTEAERVSVREYLEQLMNERDVRYNQRFIDFERAVAVAMSAAERAASKAEDASAKKFESVNEFRNTLKDQQATLLTRNEYETSWRGLELRIKMLETFRDEQGGVEKKSGQDFGMIFTIIGVIVAAAAVVVAVAFRGH